MRENYYRADIRFPLGVSAKLNRLKQEIFEKTGKRVSKSKLVEQIVSDFFERADLSSLAIKNEKST